MPTQHFDPHEGPATSDDPGTSGRPASIVIGYLVAASAWILMSGAAADRLVGSDYRQYAVFEQAKGLAFVAVTGLILWFLLRRYTNRLQQAHEEARRMARFAELSPNPIAEFEAGGVLVTANAAAHRAANALGRSVEDLLPPTAPELVQGCIETGGNVPSVLHTVGGRSWRWAFFPIDGSRAAFGYGYDRTPEARLELQVEHAARMESVGRLAAGVAHDLNNNLMAIGGLRSLVAMQVPEGGSGREELDGIREQLDHAQELVKRLLLVARMRTTADNVARVDISAELLHDEGGGQRHRPGPRLCLCLRHPKRRRSGGREPSRRGRVLQTTAAASGPGGLRPIRRSLQCLAAAPRAAWRSRAPVGVRQTAWATGSRATGPPWSGLPGGHRRAW